MIVFIERGTIMTIEDYTSSSSRSEMETNKKKHIIPSFQYGISKQTKNSKQITEWKL